IGDGVNDERGSIVISRNQLLELVFGVVQSVGIFPLDGPINRYFFPYHESHLIDHVRHGLLVWVVGQTYKVAAQFLCPAEEGSSIVFIPGPPWMFRGLFMDADSSQEDRFAVQQDIPAADFNRAEPDAVSYMVRLRSDLNFVKLWFLGRPESQVG